jgi:hypothetical protein
LGALLVGVEIGGQPLATFKHPELAITCSVRKIWDCPRKCWRIAMPWWAIEAINRDSYNVAVSGSIVLITACFCSPDFFRESLGPFWSKWLISAQDDMV